MDKSADKRRKLAGYDPQGCVDFLHTLYPTKTAASVAADTGDSARSVENWLTLASTPSVPAFLRLVRAYGPAFLAAAMPGLAWVQRAADLASYEGFGREIALMQAHQTQLERRLRGERGA